MQTKCPKGISRAIKGWMVAQLYKVHFKMQYILLFIKCREAKNQSFSSRQWFGKQCFIANPCIRKFQSTLFPSADRLHENADLIFHHLASILTARSTNTLFNDKGIIRHIWLTDWSKSHVWSVESSQEKYKRHLIWSFWLLLEPWSSELTAISAWNVLYI